jgi:signal transduction histidine kinase
VTANDIGRFHQNVEAAVYFCCLEALQNIAKYAEAGTAHIDLVLDGTQLRFSVRDDGVGFDPQAVPRGAGLQNITDRLDALDGALAIESRPGAGTTLRGCLPATPQRAEADAPPEQAAQPI